MPMLSQTGKLTIPADQMSGHALRIVIHAVKDGVGEISLSPDSLKHCSLRIHGEHETGRDCVMNLEAEDGWAAAQNHNGHNRRRLGSSECRRRFTSMHGKEKRSYCSAGMSANGMYRLKFSRSMSNC